MNRRHALGLLGATALTACAPAIQTGALGEDPFEGGIGGTGIVGVMLASGSVLINGLRVEVPSFTRIFAGGQQSGESVLVPGKAMTIVARTRLDRLEALRIDIDDPLTGILQRTATGLAINGSPVRLEPGASGGDLIGRHVAASGLWRADGTLSGSLIRLAPAPRDSIAGVLTGSQSGGWRIGGTAIRHPSGQSLQSGQYAVATGRFDAGTLLADNIVMGRFRQGGDSLQQLSVEGYLEPVNTTPGFRVAGLGHSFDRSLNLAPFADGRAVYFGRYTGLFNARRAVVLPDSQSQRRKLLLPGDGQMFAAALSDSARPIQNR
ncbi:MAG: hypothetical protein AAFP16_13830 [Pseudomonadota bacterium]